LAQAQAAVAAGQATIDSQKSAINAYARSMVQDNLPLVNVALLIDADSTASLANRLQWIDTVLNTNQVDLDQLRTIQAELTLARIEATEAQQAADLAQQAAEAQVQATEAAHAAAEAAEARLEAALAAEQAAQTTAAQVLSANQAQLAHAQDRLNAANAAVVAEERRKAEEARRAAEARAAEQARAAEAARRAEEARRASQGGSVPPPPPPASGAGNLSPSQAQATAYGMVQGYGWGDSQFQCLVWLWNRESGWRWSAENPSSGAYGIPQSLPASKMAAAGADWRTNAVTQMRWGLSYISSRYGTPCAAWAHSEATNWY
jgi:hypothetical protein